MQQLMQLSTQLQTRMAEMQEEFARLEITGESGAGLVKVVMNGRHEVRRVSIDESLFSEDKSMIEDLVAAACNDAVHKVERAQQEKMSGLASGFGLPPGKMPF